MGYCPPKFGQASFDLVLIAIVGIHHSDATLRQTHGFRNQTSLIGYLQLSGMFNRMADWFLTG